MIRGGIRTAVLAAAMTALALFAAPSPALAEPDPAVSLGLTPAADEAVAQGIPDPAAGLLSAQGKR